MHPFLTFGLSLVGGVCLLAVAIGGAVAALSVPAEGAALGEGRLAPQGPPLQPAARRPERSGGGAGTGEQERPPLVVAQATDFNKLVQLAEADCPGQTYQGPRHANDHSRFHCVNAFFLKCRSAAQGEQYRQAHRQACAQIRAAGMQCPHC